MSKEKTEQEGVDKLKKKKRYAVNMRARGYERFTTWIPVADKTKVVKFTAKLRQAHERNQIQNT